MSQPAPVFNHFGELTVRYLLEGVLLLQHCDIVQAFSALSHPILTIRQEGGRRFETVMKFKLVPTIRAMASSRAVRGR